MMVRTGRVKRILAVGMLAGVLLSGCGYTSANPPSSLVPPLEEETAEEETKAQHLEKQLIAILNLGMDGEVAANTSLEQAASFCLEYVLQDPQAYAEGEQPIDLDGMLKDRNTIAFVYDGTLSSVQVGTRFLADLAEVGFGTSVELKYQHLKNISVAYGEGDEGSVWIVLAYYQANETEADPDDGVGEETGET